MTTAVFEPGPSAQDTGVFFSYYGEVAYRAEADLEATAFDVSRQTPPCTMRAPSTSAPAPAPQACSSRLLVCSRRYGVTCFGYPDGVVVARTPHLVRIAQKGTETSEIPITPHTPGQSVLLPLASAPLALQLTPDESCLCVLAAEAPEQARIYPLHALLDPSLGPAGALAGCLTLGEPLRQLVLVQPEGTASMAAFLLGASGKLYHAPRLAVDPRPLPITDATCLAASDEAGLVAVGRAGGMLSLLASASPSQRCELQLDFSGLEGAEYGGSIEARSLDFIAPNALLMGLGGRDESEFDLAVFSPLAALSWDLGYPGPGLSGQPPKGLKPSGFLDKNMDMLEEQGEAEPADSCCSCPSTSQHRPLMAQARPL